MEEEKLSQEAINMIKLLTDSLTDRQLQMFLNEVANIRSTRSFKRYMKERRNK